MRTCFSFKSSSSSHSFKNIRVVHLNGFLEEFDDPLAVSAVTGNPSKHFIFTHAQLVSAASEYLKPEEILEPGKLYFMIPYSSFQDLSAFELVIIARRLAAVANTGHCKGKGKGKSKKKISSPPQNLDNCSRKLWKPVLSTIREISFDRRSESDLQVKYFDKQNSCSSLDIVAVPV